MADDPRVITVWMCDQCDYWRQDKTTGVHTLSNPDDWNGKLLVHALRETEFVERV